MSVSEAQDGAIRRVRSVGDLPRRPERAHIHSSLRASESTSEPYDFDIDEAPRTIPASTPVVPTTTSSLPPLQLDTPSLPTLPTQTTASSHQDSPPQPHNTALHVRVLTYLGLGRRATRARKALVSLIWSVTWGFAQVRSRFIFPSINLKLGHIVRSHHYYADSDRNPFQESF